VPYVVPADERIRTPGRVSIYLQTIARLEPGVSIEQAQANLDQIAASLTAAYPEWNRNTLLGLRPLRDHIVGARTRQWMLMLLGAVGLVLLIACANVANLLLARSTSREREVGIRAALGAGRWRLVRGLMVESLLLSFIGTVLAVVLAWWGVSVLRAAMPDGVPRLSTIAVDVRVLAAAAGIAVVTGVLFGLVPALQLSRPDLTSAARMRLPPELLRADVHSLPVERGLLADAPAQVDGLEPAAMLLAEIADLWKNVLLQMVALSLQVAEGGADEDTEGARR
jgi:predicted lysophospholipase L1 biosynthesis ABC-type transport system permease subunit